MDDKEQVEAYAGADFDEPHNAFIDHIAKCFPSLPPAGQALDMGCGAGDISRRFAIAYPEWSIDGIDGSVEMLGAAEAMASDAGIADRVSFTQVLLPAPAPATTYDLIFSNSLLHHLHDPGVFWSSVSDWGDLQTQIFVMDLIRPQDRQTAKAMVDEYAGDEPDVLQKDFYFSLLAAFEPTEIEVQIQAAGLGGLQLEVISDRHMIVWGNLSA